MSSGFPRTLLLTWQRPDGRYAGAEVLRKTLRELPQDCVRWAYLAGQAEAADGLLPVHRGFRPHALHWRLRNHALHYYFLHNVQAPRLAGAIARWIRDFKPDVVWALAEMGVVNVARLLSKRLNLPLHITVHDSYDFARFAMPRRYYPQYVRDVCCMMSVTTSLDAVSAELVENVRKQFELSSDVQTLVFPPSIRRDDMAEPPRVPADGRTRRIGLCGSLRIGQNQWCAFLRILSGLPFEFELLIFAERSVFFNLALPANVHLEFLSYAESEADVVRCFVERQVDACYLGLSDYPEQAMFGAQSLSSKLTTYAAAARPVLVHGPENSVAWRLVRQYEAGLLLSRDAALVRDDLRRLFEDGGVWRRAADGSARLCREQFDLGRNATQFAALLNESGSRPGNKEP